MAQEMKFFRCDHCGNLVGLLNDGKVPMVCCGQNMTYLDPSVMDGAGEKHVPVVTVDGDKVKVVVSEVAHPMTEAHLIDWIYLQTEKGGQRKVLHADEAPGAEFVVVDDKPLVVYSHCNLHGLWKTEVK